MPRSGWATVCLSNPSTDSMAAAALSGEVRTVTSMLASVVGASATSRWKPASETAAE
jgi:hypothetical protein